MRDPERRFGPRTLDVDVIAVWGDDGEPVLSDDPELTLPHPRAHLRAFVLRPWLDIQPYGQLPGHGWLTDLLDRRTARRPTTSLELRPRPGSAVRVGGNGPSGAGAASTPAGVDDRRGPQPRPGHAMGPTRSDDPGRRRPGRGRGGLAADQQLLRLNSRRCPGCRR